MDLYELTRKLVRRGCPEHPRLVNEEGMPHSHEWLHAGLRRCDRQPINESDARAIWTMWALEWCEKHRISFASPWYETRTKGSSFDWPISFGYIHTEKLLEAIEAATRHLTPSPAAE